MLRSLTGKGAASHRDFSARVGNLNPSDKGNMMERWYRTVYGKGAEKHVTVRRAFSNTAGKVKQRVIDLFEIRSTRRGPRGTIKELKAVDGPIGNDPKFWSQFEHYLEMVRTKITTEKGKVLADRLNYVFTSPEGAKRNRAAMERMFNLAEKKDASLAIELFDGTGRRHTVNSVDELNEVMKRFFKP